jgi:hypothetical protein
MSLSLSLSPSLSVVNVSVSGVCLSVCLSIYLSIYLSASACLPAGPSLSVIFTNHLEQTTRYSCEGFRYTFHSEFQLLSIKSKLTLVSFRSTSLTYLVGLTASSSLSSLGLGSTISTLASAPPFGSFLRPMLLNLFCPQFMNFCTKLECLSLGSLSSLV